MLHLPHQTPWCSNNRLGESPSNRCHPQTQANVPKHLPKSYVSLQVLICFWDEHILEPCHGKQEEEQFEPGGSTNFEIVVESGRFCPSVVVHRINKQIKPPRLSWEETMVLSQNGIICSWNVFWRMIIIIVNIEALCANQGDIFGVVSRSENFRIDVVPRWFGWSGSLGRIGSLEELSRISFGNYIDIPDGTVYLAPSYCRWSKKTAM